MSDRAEKIRELRRRMGTLPHQAPEVSTRFLRGVEGIQVDLLDGPVNPYRSMFAMATSTWGAATADVARRWEETDPEDRFEVVRSVLLGQALPLALEAPKFAFAISGLSRWSFDQIVRARLGVVYASLGTRDNCHADIPFRFHESTWREPGKLRLAKEVALRAKAAYGMFMDSGVSSWQEGRELLPISVVHRFVMAINFAALRSMCGSRMTFSEAEDTVAVVWLLRDRLMKADAFPYLAAWLRPRCDYAGACCYHRAHTMAEAFGCLYRSCGRNPVRSASGMPPIDYELADFNEACSDAETISRQLGIRIPGPAEERPEGLTFADLTPRDRLLLEEDGGAFELGPSGTPSMGVGGEDLEP